MHLTEQEVIETNQRHRRSNLKWWLDGQMLVVEAFRAGASRNKTVSTRDIREICNTIERKVKDAKRDPDAFLDPKFADLLN